MDSIKKPNKSELEFLTLSYNRFYDIYDEIFDEDFWILDEWYRFSVISQGFLIYSELLNYEPIMYSVEKLRTSRPPMEYDIGKFLFKFVRNLLSHFPYFTSWDEIKFNKNIINWNKTDGSIDRFISKYEGHSEVKYRFWEEEKKRMTYISINFPKTYGSDDIYLKDLIEEKSGAQFSYILMKEILNTQVID
ncbi:hypothetical protein [Seleniivibrio woodruffii]|uniref:hypothetical protein n=1 Tax=Seleniivibrio woodruffii TaxID=1078050 RepID=UPI002409A91D|nr:hypothetical protein [Seleniivibrio woodruffii]